MLMVQTNSHIPMNRGKVTRPPPVPPRPNQNVVAEALAKTRRAITESSAKAKSASADQKRTYVNIKDRDSSIPVPVANASPKSNGLARVKSFIKDVISDRSSADERKLNGKSNSKNSLSNGSTTELSNSSHVSILKSKTVSSDPHSTTSNVSSKIEKPSKLSKQSLVRSFSASIKNEQERKIIKKDGSLEKNRVTKSSSFAEKSIVLPLRKAPPPPLSPKPKLRRPESKIFTNTDKRISGSKECLPNKQVDREIETVCLPDKVETKVVNGYPPATIEATYETINDVALLKYIDRVTYRVTAEPPEGTKLAPQSPCEYDCELNKKTLSVTEMLISEIIANKDKHENNEYVDNSPMIKANNIVLNGVTHTSTADDEDENRERRLKNINNHEMLISELQSMRTDKIENDTECYGDESGDNANDESHDMSHLYHKEQDLHSRLQKQFTSISNMSLQGLPPLPKSLSSFHVIDNFSDCDDGGRLDSVEDPDSCNVTGDKPRRISTSLDTKLAVLKKEMGSLRRLDLSLLSELWALNESMHEWRLRLERRSSGGRLRPAPPPPPRTPSPPTPSSDHSNEMDYPDSSA